MSALDSRMRGGKPIPKGSSFFVFSHTNRLEIGSQSNLILLFCFCFLFLSISTVYIPSFIDSRPNKNKNPWASYHTRCVCFLVLHRYQHTCTSKSLLSLSVPPYSVTNRPTSITSTTSVHPHTPLRQQTKERKDRTKTRKKAKKAMKTKRRKRRRKAKLMTTARRRGDRRPGRGDCRPLLDPTKSFPFPLTLLSSVCPTPTGSRVHCDRSRSPSRSRSGSISTLFPWTMAPLFHAHTIFPCLPLLPLCGLLAPSLWTLPPLTTVGYPPFSHPHGSRRILPLSLSPTPPLSLSLSVLYIRTETGPISGNEAGSSRPELAVLHRIPVI
jgi:hypothetical protein